MSKRDPNCPKYNECLSQAAKVNKDFSCVVCKKTGNKSLVLNSVKEPKDRISKTQVPETEKLINDAQKKGFSGEYNVRRNRHRLLSGLSFKCQVCTWMNSCKNIKPSCYEPK